MSAHTPGPWYVHPTWRRVCANGSHDFVVGESPYWMAGKIKSATCLANMALIAAAPDLLEACKTFEEWLRREAGGSEEKPWRAKRGTPEGEAEWRKWYDENLRLCALAQEQARAAIAKATDADA